jgi:hypothetical protein
MIPRNPDRSALPFWLSLLVLIAVAFLFITGAAVLTAPLFGSSQVPAGTPITWAGLVALPLTLRLGIRPLDRPTEPFRTYRVLLNGILLLALAWGLVSYALAGNWSFSFSGAAAGFRGSPAASVYFWYYTYAVAGLPLLWGLVYGGHMVVRRWRGRK